MAAGIQRHLRTMTTLNEIGVAVSVEREQERLIALVVIEVVLITTAVLLYVRWAQLKREPLDEWWEGRRTGR